MTACILCQKNPAPIVEEGKSFCCHGCSFVYRVLKGRGLDPSIEAPLYQKAEELGLFAEKAPKTREGEALHLAFWIEGLFCPACEHLLAHTIGKMEGILSISVDYTTDLCILWYQPRYVSQDEIFKQITSLGYVPHELESLDSKGWAQKLSWRTGVAAFCTLNVMMASYPLLGEGMVSDPKWGLFFTLYSFAAALPVPVYAAWPLLKQGIASFIRLKFGVEAFISVAMLSGFVLSAFHLAGGRFELYLDAATLLPTLFLFGKLLECKVKGEAREKLIEVARTLPLRARRGGEYIPLKDVKLCDELLILRGEKVVLDGEIVEGSAFVDESVITGESLPISKKLGDTLLAGSRLTDGWVMLRVLKTKEGSTLETMVSLMEEGLKKSSSYKHALDRFLPYFLPVILILSGFLFFWRGAFDALGLLLLACPCTLGIALPLARSYLGSALGAQGIVVRRMEALDQLGQETHLLFDKTGTLTEGEPELLKGLETIPEEEKRVIKTLVSRSNHPLCRSIRKALETYTEAELSHVEEVVGKGMQGGGRKLGSRAWFEELSQPLPPPHDEMELFYKTEENLYMFIFQEKIREGAEAWIKSLEKVSIEIISGDRSERVEKLAKRLLIPKWNGSMDPESKQKRVLEIKQAGGRVFFIGDGVNDGLALSVADLSASPESGQDLTLFVSDLIIRGSFEKMIEARKLGIKARKISLQNLTLSFAYNGLAILWALFGAGLTPLLSALVMGASSLTVIWNTGRITAK